MRHQVFRKVTYDRCWLKALEHALNAEFRIVTFIHNYEYRVVTYTHHCGSPLVTCLPHLFTSLTQKKQNTI